MNYFDRQFEGKITTEQEEVIRKLGMISSRTLYAPKIVGQHFDMEVAALSY